MFKKTCFYIKKEKERNSYKTLIYQRFQLCINESQNDIFGSLSLRQMKTPLKSEPPRFGHQWCFCYNPSVCAASQALRHWILFGLKIRKG